MQTLLSPYIQTILTTFDNNQAFIRKIIKTGFYGFISLCVCGGVGVGVCDVHASAFVMVLHNT